MLEGGCHVPVGALARTDAGVLLLRGVVASPDGSRVIRGEATGPEIDADGIGRRLAGDLLERGAREILAECET